MKTYENIKVIILTQINMKNMIQMNLTLETMHLLQKKEGLEE